MKPREVSSFSKNIYEHSNYQKVVFPAGPVLSKLREMDHREFLLSLSLLFSINMVYFFYFIYLCYSKIRTDSWTLVFPVILKLTAWTPPGSDPQPPNRFISSFVLRLHFLILRGWKKTGRPRFLATPHKRTKFWFSVEFLSVSVASEPSRVTFYFFFFYLILFSDGRSPIKSFSVPRRDTP